MIRSFIDSGVLVTAARTVGELSEKALSILEDPEREFASSQFIKLEVIPKAVYNKQNKEAEFYETFFNNVTYWAPKSQQNQCFEYQALMNFYFRLTTLERGLRCPL